MTKVSEARFRGEPAIREYLEGFDGPMAARSDNSSTWFNTASQVRYIGAAMFWLAVAVCPVTKQAWLNRKEQHMGY
jgi:hypothetical protein